MTKNKFEVTSEKPKNIKKKATIAIVLAVVAVALVIGTYLWLKGRVQTGADVTEQTLDEEQSATGNDEWKVGDNKVALPSGTLVKAENKPEVYLVYRGKKQLITSASTFTFLGLKWENIIVVTPSYLNLYENGDNINTAESSTTKLPNGLIVKFSNEPTVYSVAGGKIKPYPSASVYLSRHTWNEMATLQDSWKLGMAVDSNPMTYRGGNLVKDSSNPTVYWVASKQKFPIPSEKVFNDFGFNWVNLINAESGILNGYNTGKDIDKLDNIPLLAWKRPNAATVHLIKYYNGQATDLIFSDASVFLSRFKWTEINTVKRIKNESPTPSSSTNTPEPLPSGQVKCTVNEQTRNTNWQEISLNDYAKAVYPSGITKMFEVTRADSADDPTTMQIIYNIKNTTNSTSNSFASGDKVKFTADILFTHGRNGASQINTPGELRTALRNTQTNSTLREWIVDDLGDVKVNIHKVVEKPEYTLPTNITPDLISFWVRYNYYAGDNDWCHWPASSEDPYTVFPKLNP